MARVTVAEVKCITNTSISDALIQAYTDAANAIINERLECINATDEVLKQIELFLSCHLVALQDGSGALVKSRKAEQLQTTYLTAEISDSINQTTYGKTANALANGCLASYDQESVYLFSSGGSC